MRWVFCVLPVVMALSMRVPAQTETSARQPTPAGAAKTTLSYNEARPILNQQRENLPPELRLNAGLESAWSAWVSRHNTTIRARLERGDEDSIINLWLFGTSFTALPRATARDLARLGEPAIAAIIDRRLEDLLAGIAAPGTNERLQFARRVVERAGIDPTRPAGRDRLGRRLVEARQRVAAEFERFERIGAAAARLNDQSAELLAHATIFRDRGLSSDTSIQPNFALERTLEALRSTQRLAAGSVRRVAVVGPGLDFTGRADGYDFYPLQTIQPFALIDSLIRLGLATPDALRVTTFDVSPRINQHLEAARSRARRGEAYLLHLPLDRDERWNASLVTYWRRFGDRIGDEVAPVAAPEMASVDVRAVRVRPEVVLSISPQDVNIVVERPEPLAMGDRFDLVIATNVLVYYSPFEQALAVANVAKILRPQGLLLSNNAVFPIPPMSSSAQFVTVAYSDRTRDGDTIFWYQRE